MRAHSGAAIQNLTNGYDLAGNITGITDAVVSGRSQTLGYDNLNRVASASASGSYGSQSYTYDGVGNRLTRVLGGATETYAYSSTANRVATVTAGGNTRTFSYQASGQVSQDVRDASHTYTFAANDNGRNASAALNGTTAGAYLYNAFEQRGQKTVGSAVTQFVFDRFGHLLAEANGSGAVQKEYLWLDDVPVAVVDASGAAPVLYFIHSDPLGTPQKITNAAAVIVWDGVFDPFGNAQFVSGAGVWNTSTWDNFTWGADLSLSNLRFPGQYADAETALNQNWFRDYDPAVGRYIQSDPIGLRGGPNTYNYVDGKPANEIDPTGLVAQMCFGIPVTFPHFWLCGKGTCAGFVPKGNPSSSGELFGTPGMSRPEAPGSGVCLNETPMYCNPVVFELCVASAMAEPTNQTYALVLGGESCRTHAQHILDRCKKLVCTGIR